MTFTDRHAEFISMYAKLHGDRSQKIAAITAAINVKHNTVEGWLCEKPHRMISADKLPMLRELVKAQAENETVTIAGHVFAKSTVEEAML